MPHPVHCNVLFINLLTFNDTTLCLKKMVKIVIVITLSNVNNFGNFWHKDGLDHFPPYLIYVNALPRETQML